MRSKFRPARYALNEHSAFADWLTDLRLLRELIRAQSRAAQVRAYSLARRRNAQQLAVFRHRAARDPNATLMQYFGHCAIRKRHLAFCADEFPDHALYGH